VERAADWDAQWRVEPLDPAAVEAEGRTPRWRAQERLVRARFGGFDGLEVVVEDRGLGTGVELQRLRAGAVSRGDGGRFHRRLG